jgi:hypothetical protein
MEVFSMSVLNYLEFCINPLTLRFVNDREEAFLQDYTQKSLNQIRFGLALAMLLYPLFGILDYLLLPDVKEQVWFIRYAIVCPFLLLILLFTWTRHFKRFSQHALVLAVLVLGSGVIAMTVVAYPPRQLLLLRRTDPYPDVDVYRHCLEVHLCNRCWLGSGHSLRDCGHRVK